ncbi:MAG: hypothetical protein EBV83_10250 [Verrucomicrobia bacterium]|nr:hypothetical protein [Verrucomicrobiota bacterium]
MGNQSDLIIKLLRECGQASIRLGISERTLRYKLARYREHGILAESA